MLGAQTSSNPGNRSIYHFMNVSLYVSWSSIPVCRQWFDNWNQTITVDIQITQKRYFFYFKPRYVVVVHGRRGVSRRFCKQTKLPVAYAAQNLHDARPLYNPEVTVWRAVTEIFFVGVLVWSRNNETLRPSIAFVASIRSGKFSRPESRERRQINNTRGIFSYAVPEMFSGRLISRFGDVHCFSRYAILRFRDAGNHVSTSQESAFRTNLSVH